MTIRFPALLLPVAAVAVFWPTLGGAALAMPAGQDEQTICQLDATRLCQDYVPDEDQITACMIAKRRQLSPACGKALDAGMKKRRAR